MWRILAMASVLLLTLSGQLAGEYSLLRGAHNNGSVCAAHRWLVAQEHAFDVLPRRAEQERGSLPRDPSDVRGEQKLLGRLAGEAKQWIVCRWRLGGIDVDRG